jgi:CHAT domain-containing protein/Tfp pilus assembly protein PilF
VSSRFFVCLWVIAVLSLHWAVPRPVFGPAAALGDEPAPPQAAAKPAEAPAKDQPKYTPQQQQRLDETAKLTQQIYLLSAQGKFADATKLAQQVLSTREEILGSQTPDIVTDLNNLAELYKEEGNYAAALPLLQRGLKIREQTLGPEHADTAASLGNLAALYDALGDYAAALPLFQRALKIDEKTFGPEHPYVAGDLGNLAVLYQAQGNYAQAQPLLERALKISEKLFPPDHPELAVDLSNLAVLYQAQQNYSAALPLLERALKIQEKVYGPDHPYVANDLNNLAELYQEQENYAEALPLYQRALAIREKMLGPQHPSTALSLNNLGGLYYAQGNDAQALPLIQRALEIRKKLLGPEHPDVAVNFNNLGLMYQAQGNFDEAMPLLMHAAESMIRHLELTAGVQAERQQLADIRQSRLYLDSVISCALAAAQRPGANDEALGNKVYAQMLAWKGAVTLRQQLERAAQQGNDPEEQKLWQQLQALSTRLTTESRSVPRPDQQESWHKQLTDLTQSKEELEAELSQRSAEFRRLRWQTKLTPDQLAKQLPVDAALVDLLQFKCLVGEKQPDSTTKIHPEQRLAAFVTRADRPAAMIDLGLMQPINSAVQQWRASYGASLANQRPEEQPGLLLRKLLWEPLAPHLDKIKTVLISPDGEVSKLPWAALPGSKPDTYLIEDIAVALIPVPQMLPDLLAASPSPRLSPGRGKGDAPTLLLVGDVDYNAAPGNPQPSAEHALLAATEQHPSAVRGQQDSSFSALPGTAREIQRIEELYHARFAPAEALQLKQAAATQDRVRQEAPKYRYLHLATHGFFAPPTIHSALSSGQTEPVSEVFRAGQERSVAGYNPGLLSGLALAGANRGNRSESSHDPTASSTDDGIMTALEVSSLDLQHVDLAVLSACETGLGQTAGGEGTLGLQRAFQVAGARTTISSLWSVDDAATQALMVEFYSRLWDKNHPLGKLEALRQAQLAMLHHYDPRTAKLVDRSRGLEPDTAPSETSGRLSPKYWAAFQPSGDWR